MLPILVFIEAVETGDGKGGEKVASGGLGFQK